MKRNYTLNNPEEQSMNNRFLPHLLFQREISRQEQEIQNTPVYLRVRMFVFPLLGLHGTVVESKIKNFQKQNSEFILEVNQFL